MKIALFFLVFLIEPLALVANPAELSISVDHSRPQRGESVELRIESNSIQAPQAVLLLPTAGKKELRLERLPDQKNTFRATVVIGNTDPEGLYLAHAWTGPASAPTSVGKIWFLVGRLVADFFIPAYLDNREPSADFLSYLKDFRAVGGNMLIAHNLITPSKAYYPSKIARTDVTPGAANDLVEMMLSTTDKMAIPVLLSVGWDMTKQTPYKDRMPEIKAIANELYDLYKSHPSLAGFYSYQEGSGTYFVPFVREFARHIKSLNPTLLTAIAPHVDDPLLAGYLSTIEDLDIMIYQAGVMASYRPDNRKLYPFRRVRDFCSLGTGAKRLQNKIAVTHVELFGYLENRLTPNTTATTHKNIYQQILSAATVANADGIAFFTYHAHVYEIAKKLREAERSRIAVSEGMKAFDLISAKISRQNNPLAIYFPYSDWIVERWHNYFLPALDAFRVLGVPVDLLPYAPPLDESVYPYYPFHANQDVLARLLREPTVMILPNVSGFQQTDSDLVKAFVEQGGVVVAFGPQVPMGRSYERAELFGVTENKKVAHTSIVVREAIGGRVRSRQRFTLPQSQLAGWSSTGGQLIAAFEDGSPAVTLNKYGKGATIAVLVDAQTAVRTMPDLVRDVLEYASTAGGKSLLVDIVGTKESSDVAIEQTNAGFRFAVVNHDSEQLELLVRPLRQVEEREWLDLTTNMKISDSRTIPLQVPAGGFRAVELRASQPSH